MTKNDKARIISSLLLTGMCLSSCSGGSAEQTAQTSAVTPAYSETSETAAAEKSSETSAASEETTSPVTDAPGGMSVDILAPVRIPLTEITDPTEYGSAELTARMKEMCYNSHSAEIAEHNSKCTADNGCISVESYEDIGFVRGYTFDYDEDGINDNFVLLTYEPRVDPIDGSTSCTLYYAHDGMDIYSSVSKIYNDFMICEKWDFRDYMCLYGISGSTPLMHNEKLFVFSEDGEGFVLLSGSGIMYNEDDMYSEEEYGDTGIIRLLHRPNLGEVFYPVIHTADGVIGQVGFEQITTEHFLDVLSSDDKLREVFERSADTGQITSVYTAGYICYYITLDDPDRMVPYIYIDDYREWDPPALPDLEYNSEYFYGYDLRKANVVNSEYVSASRAEQ